jgi:hypothetical protein
MSKPGILGLGPEVFPQGNDVPGFHQCPRQAVLMSFFGGNLGSGRFDGRAGRGGIYIDYICEGWKDILAFRSIK